MNGLFGFLRDINHINNILFCENITDSPLFLIKLDSLSEQSIRVPIKDPSEFVPLDTETFKDFRVERFHVSHLDINVKVTSIEQSSSQLGSIPDSIINSVLRISEVRLHNGRIIYRINNGTKSYMVLPSDLKYKRMIFSNIDDMSNFHIGQKVIAVGNHSCGKLYKGDELIVLSMNTSFDTMLHGTIYLENILTKERITTYPRFLRPNEI